MQHFDQAIVYFVTDRRRQIIPLKLLTVLTIAAPTDNTHSILLYLKGLQMAHPVTHDKESAIYFANWSRFLLGYWFEWLFFKFGEILLVYLFA
jgi:hypothetical protein